MMPSFPTETLSRGSLHVVVRRWRVAFKLWLSKYKCIASFCKDCGRDVTDFIVPDDVWIKIEPTIKRGRVLCYDCFCEHCRQIGLPAVWKLEAPSNAPAHRPARINMDSKLQQEREVNGGTPFAEARGSASPETEYPKCRHCGSDKGSWFSRVMPMGNFCENCGGPWTETDGVE
jgi:hypothetical protein